MKNPTLFRPLLALFALILLLPATALADEPLTEEQLLREPGYVDFGDLWKYSDGDEEVEIHLTQPLLGVVGAFVRGEDPELADLILDLHLVKVNQFSFERADEENVRKIIDDTAGDLRKDGWDNIIKVRERDERVNVFVKFAGESRSHEEAVLSGLAVLVLENDSAAFVNVVGRFRLQDIARVGAQFDIPYTDDWDHYNKRGRKSDSDEENAPKGEEG